ALEQLIIGPLDTNPQSVLWPGDKSLVPRMLGIFGINPASFQNGNPEFPTVPLDKHPFNGYGVNVISTVAGGQLTGAAVVDQNHNGLPDNGQNGEPDNSHFLFLNTSPAALLPLGIMNFINPVNIANGSASYRTQYINMGFPAIDVGYTYPD